MIARFAGLALMALVTGGSQAGAVTPLTVGDYIRFFQGDLDVQASPIEVYLLGVLDSAAVMNGVAAKAGVGVFCVPEDAPELTFEGFLDDFDAYLARLEEERPDFEEVADRLTLAQVAIAMFVERFPCGGEQEGGG